MPWIDPLEEYAVPPRLPHYRSPASDWEGEVEIFRETGRLESALVSGVTIDLVPHETLEIMDCELVGVTLKTGGQSRVDLIDSTLTECDLSQVRVGMVRGMRFEGCKLAGTNFSGSEIRDVRLERCTMRYTNLRMSRLERVTCLKCSLDDADFYQAAIKDLSFDGCELTDVNLDRARFERVDFRGATSMGVTGITDLHGCLLGDAQVQELAFVLATAAGASIERFEY